jgi:hypothetical protein
LLSLNYGRKACLFPPFPYLCAAKSINKYHCGWRLNDLALYESIKKHTNPKPPKSPEGGLAHRGDYSEYIRYNKSSVKIYR